MVQELNGGQFVLVEFDDLEFDDLKFAKINELLDILQYQLEANDIYLVSQDWQDLGNDSGAVSFYSVRNDLSYLVAVEDIKKMGKSGNLMMYGHTPDEYDLEDIERVFGDEEDVDDEYLKESKKINYDEAVRQFDIWSNIWTGKDAERLNNGDLFCNDGGGMYGSTFGWTLNTDGTITVDVEGYNDGVKESLYDVLYDIKGNKEQYNKFLKDFKLDEIDDIREFINDVWNSEYKFDDDDILKWLDKNTKYDTDTIYPETTFDSIMDMINYSIYTFSYWPESTEFEEAIGYKRD